jgi:SAM-dependent methyltransferase
VSRWEQACGASGPERGRAYAQRFATLAAQGQDVHGEASLAASLVGPGARVLDAGCGTGRVAIRLAELGFAVVGVDVDPAMLDVARDQAPDLTWLLGDLAALDQVLPAPGGFDLVVAAGNVIALVSVGTEAQVVSAIAGQLTDGGLLLAGFGLQPAYLPIPQAPLTLIEYDAMCTRAGLALVDRWATWDAQPYAGGGYAVILHARASSGAPA